MGSEAFADWADGRLYFKTMSDLVSENELPKNLKDLYLKGASAMELRNYGYAVTLFQAVLKDEPRFLDGRKKRLALSGKIT